MSAPQFSVIIPAFNAEDFIGDALRSVYAQTVQDMEVIVINDGSSDGTLAVLEQVRDPRLRVVTLPNGGVSRARNCGIREARGEYVAFLDADDLWAPDHLEHAAEFFKEHPDIHWYAAKWVGGTMNVHQLSRQPGASYDISNYYHEGRHRIWTSTVVLQKSAIGSESLFPESLEQAEDLMAWWRFASRNPLLGVYGGVTAMYRMRGTSASHTRERGYTRVFRHQDALYEVMEAIKTPESCYAWASLYKKMMMVSCWHFIINNNSLRIFLPIVRKHWRSMGIVGSFYITAYIILNDALAQAFAFPMRINRRIFDFIAKKFDK